MIFITGDCHGDYRRLNTQNFPIQKKLTRNDFIIVCGDFGFWNPSREQDWWLDWLSAKPFTLLWVDGNHENFDLLKEYPIHSWKGGKVQYIRDNVVHLMRGQIFELEGASFFTFGGARSHDIQDGILDIDDEDFAETSRQLRARDALFRVNHISWWKEELPDKQEMDEGKENLEKHGWQVDYIITHCAPTAFLEDLQALPDLMTDYLEEIRRRCEYKKWFFGHYHDNRELTEKDRLLYEQILRIT